MYISIIVPLITPNVSVVLVVDEQKQVLLSIHVDVSFTSEIHNLIDMI